MPELEKDKIIVCSDIIYIINLTNYKIERKIAKLAQNDFICGRPRCRFVLYKNGKYKGNDENHQGMRGIISLKDNIFVAMEPH